MKSPFVLAQNTAQSQTHWFALSRAVNCVALRTARHTNTLRGDIMAWEIPNEDEARNVELNRYLDTLEEQPPEPDPDWITPPSWEDDE